MISILVKSFKSIQNMNRTRILFSNWFSLGRVFVCCCLVFCGNLSVCMMAVFKSNFLFELRISKYVCQWLLPRVQILAWLLFCKQYLLIFENCIHCILIIPPTPPQSHHPLFNHPTSNFLLFFFSIKSSLYCTTTFGWGPCLALWSTCQGSRY